MTGRPLSERLEQSTVGRAIISVLIVAVLGIVVVWNLPDSELRQRSVTAVRTVAQGAGLDQNWAVFAPNPRRISLDLYALVEYPDGETVRWQLPEHSEPFLSPYRTYRWRKFMEHVRADRNEHRLWDPAARWVADQFTTDERTPETVTLVRRWYDIPKPGSGADVPEWSEYPYHVYEVPS